MRRSAKDTLLAALEEADCAEECIVVMTNANGDLIWLCTTDKKTVKIGLLETVKLQITADMRSEVIERDSEKSIDKLKIQ